MPSLSTTSSRSSASSSSSSMAPSKHSSMTSLFSLSPLIKKKSQATPSATTSPWPRLADDEILDDDNLAWVKIPKRR
ncbi:hypothetical protein SISNIDRAFT_487152 [Sistotremastrum niveocremeum HHB9708]|uniref:Uncharacterized protein n=2 Tax=Sistotremastraceae TaxID=3402574 RepID=A0A164SV64_9AGAM|nr:hypothetical protein SISNIDRAFT_487152 [Sistotremastrum niveocremeum HHB9708]KZT40421.1 hypothetical protein SISSUDRAFT_1060346 [Sistotremastrum suecicum HHB10207 ss-3]